VVVNRRTELVIKALCDIVLTLGPYVLLIALPLGVTTYMRGGPKNKAEWVGLLVIATIAAAGVFILERRARSRLAARRSAR
jgi:hypothetical protein